MGYIIQSPPEIHMDDPSSKRPKKSDKAKDKRGKPTSKHVRQYEASLSKYRSRGNDPVVSAQR